jgi:IS30 family transposase
MVFTSALLVGTSSARRQGEYRPSRLAATRAPGRLNRLRRLLAELRRSLTWDRGLKMVDHKEFSIATDVNVYFCDTQSPWQRGTNENTNRLLRQYFPKKTDRSPSSQADLNRLALQLNPRPERRWSSVLQQEYSTRVLC